MCIREFQKSLEQSVKRLLEDKIQSLGLGPAFRVFDSHIESPRDGLIIFQGMQSHNAESIKSLEGYDIAWVEEAQSLSQRSLDLLRPTIRKPGSEIWFSWNPNFPTDPVDQYLRPANKEDMPPNTVVVEARWDQNPWFPDALIPEMLYDRRRDPDRYQHIWLGGYLRNSEARVFQNWRIEEFEEPPAGTRLFYGADWGFSIDPSVLVRCWIAERTLYVDHEVYQVGCPIDKLPELFQRIPGSKIWPSRADSARPETIDYMKRHGYPLMQPAVKGKNSVEDGIEFLKAYDIVVHPRCRHTADELSMYSWKIDRKTEEVLPILEDQGNHVIDALRYALEGERLGPQPMMITRQLIQTMARPSRFRRRLLGT